MVIWRLGKGCGDEIPRSVVEQIHGRDMSDMHLVDGGVFFLGI